VTRRQGVRVTPSPCPPVTLSGESVMAQRLTSSRLANLEANAIYTAREAFQTQFKAITGRARARFAQRDWHGMQADAAERLDIYRQVVEQTVAEIRHALADRLHDALVWASIKAVYSGLI